MKAPTPEYKIGQKVIIQRIHDIGTIVVQITQIRGRAISWLKGGAMLYTGKDKDRYTILFSEADVKGVLAK